jgi:hypothetical protein
VPQQHPDVPLAPVFRQAGDRRHAAHPHWRAVYEHREVVQPQRRHDLTILDKHERIRQLLDVTHPLPPLLGAITRERIRDHEMHAVEFLLAGGTDFGHSPLILSGACDHRHRAIIAVP